MFIQLSAEDVKAYESGDTNADRLSFKYKVGRDVLLQALRKAGVNTDRLHRLRIGVKRRNKERAKRRSTEACHPFYGY